MKDLIKKEVNADDYDHPLAGLHVIEDAGNGAAGFFAGAAGAAAWVFFSCACFALAAFIAFSLAAFSF